MVRHRMAMALRPVHRIKHVVDLAQTLASGVILPLVVVRALDAPVLANTTEIETGAKCYGIYLKVEVASNEATVAGGIPNFYLAVLKDPGGNLAVLDPSTVGANDNKRFVIHQEMAMIQNQISSNPRTIFAGVIKIPRGFSRFGINDQLVVYLKSPVIDVSVCVQCIFKEFR